MQSAEFNKGYDRGLFQGDRMSLPTKALQIRENTNTIRDLMTEDGFDQQAADRVVRLAGHIAGLVDSI